jgi:hypothetical protein
MAISEAERAEARRLEAAHGHWGEDSQYILADWQHEVANDTTRLGYWEWVAPQYALTEEA